MNTGDTRATWHGRGRLDSTAVIGPLQLRDVELVHAPDRCHDPARPGSTWSCIISPTTDGVTLYFIGSSSISVCHFYATFGVSQAKSDRPIKALENTGPLAFTQIEEAS
jgi:hypothetical protein